MLYEVITVMPVTSKQDDYAIKVCDDLKKAGLIAKTDLRNEKINYKIREHSVTKIPVIMVVGDKERDSESVTVRRLGSDKQEVISLKEAIKALTDEAKMPSMDK